MIKPVYIDLAMSFSAMMFGLVLLFARMKVSNKNIYTSMTDVAIICAGSLSWAVFGFLALSIVIEYPDWHSRGYVGHWGYTSARILGFISWLLTLHIINQYSAYMQCRMIKK